MGILKWNQDSTEILLDCYHCWRGVIMQSTSSRNAERICIFRKSFAPYKKHDSIYKMQNPTIKSIKCNLFWYWLRFCAAFQILIEMTMKDMGCSTVKLEWRFRGLYCLHLRDLRAIQPIGKTQRGKNICLLPTSLSLHGHCCETSKSPNVPTIFCRCGLSSRYVK
jgi:hypothetical protein